MVEVGVRLLIARKTAFTNLKFEKSMLLINQQGPDEFILVSRLFVDSMHCLDTFKPMLVHRSENSALNSGPLLKPISFRRGYQESHTLSRICWHT